jgi:DNA ligase D-like protein (predicted 3'-phosphoesterase)
VGKEEFLKEYHDKRSFDRTAEAFGSRKRKGDRPIFVIQKHAASTLHYDFRLEVDGVLKSWAVPKGPSMDPREKRLALPTEEHPVEYADFEGTIPEGQYGGGTVMVWDAGTYRNLKGEEGQSLADQVRDGHVTVRLDGKKLEGGFALIRTGQGEEARWLLVKMDDDAADARRNPVSTETKSVLTGRTMKQIRQAGQEGDDDE